MIRPEKLSKRDYEKLAYFLEQGQSSDRMSITELHGFLSALIGVPRMVPPSEWFHYVFGQDGVGVETQADYQEIMGLVLSFYNEVSDQLASRKAFTFPMYQDGKLTLHDQIPEVIEKTWCQAYMHAINVESVFCTEDIWLRLFPIVVLSGDQSLIGEEDNEGNTITNDRDHLERYRNGLPEYVLTIYHLWEDARKYAAEHPEPIHREQKIGRNEPCPCKSGKKYKKCCGTEAPTYH